MNTLSHFKKHVSALTGSNATTAAGLAKAWRAYRTNYKAAVLRFPERFQMDSRKQVTLPGRLEAWQDRQKTRRADPELKRATKDKVFRKNLVTRLRREAKRLAKPVASALDLVGLKRRINLLRGVNITLESLGSKPVPEPTWPPYLLMDCDLTPKQIKALRNKIGGSALVSAQWKYEAGLTNRVAAHVYSESTKKNGSWRTVAYSDHRIEYQSFGVILEGGHVWETLIDGEVNRHVLPDDVTLELTHGGSALFVFVNGLDRPVTVWPSQPTQPDPNQWRDLAFERAAEKAFAA